MAQAKNSKLVLEQPLEFERRELERLSFRGSKLDKDEIGSS
jgi:hypothetical protein